MARGSGRPPTNTTHAMAHPDLAQLAGVVAAAGVVLMLAGRGRLMVLGGLGLLGAAEAGLLASRSDTASFDRLASASGAVLVVFGLLVMAAAAAVLVRRPGWLPVVMILAAPLRPPIAFESGGGFPLSIATGGPAGAPAAAVLRPGRGRRGAGLARLRPRPSPPARCAPCRAWWRCPRPRSRRSRACRWCGPTSWARRSSCCRTSRSRSWCCWRCWPGRRSPTPPRAPWPSRPWPWAPCSPRSACTRRPRASCSSTRPTWRCRTPTATSSA